MGFERGGLDGFRFAMVIPSGAGAPVRLPGVVAAHPIAQTLLAGVAGADWPS
jgi:hypothetical protein